NLAFKTSNVLRGMISDTRNGVTVRDEMPRPIVSNRARAQTKRNFFRRGRLWGMLGKFHNLPFGDASNLIQVQASFALDVFGMFRGPKESISDHGNRRDRSNAHREDEFPI